MLLKIFTIVVLIGIIYEDFRYRLVKVFLYLLLLFVLVAQRVSEISITDYLVFAGINLAYILLLLGICFGFIYFKYGTMKIIDNFFGIGDVFFLISIATWFDPITFVFFNTISFAVALIAHFALKNFPFYQHKHSVPLAGMQSLCFVPVFIITTYQ
jgi:hypothetical protein